MSEIRLLLVKIGTKPGLESIISHLRQILPNVKLYGITTQNVLTHSLFDTVVAKEADTTLGTYPELLSNSLYVRPELYETVKNYESALLRMCDGVALHDLTTLNRPSFSIPSFNNSSDDRQQLVLRQLSFWDYVLQQYEIDAVISANYGHNVSGFAIETVARSCQIPILFFHEVRPFLSSLYVCESLADLDDASFGRGLIDESRSNGWNIGDSDERESLMLQQAGIYYNSENRHLTDSEKQVTARPRSLRWIQHYSRHPLQRLRNTLRRRMLTFNSKKEEKHVSKKTVPEKFLFIELQSQPNGTTARKGWMYPDLRELVAHISQNLPEGQSLVVRESPRQWARMYPRRKGFWRSIAAIPKVVVIDPTVPVQGLINRASAVIELSYSTLAFNAVSQGTPVIVLGHTHLRGILGVFPVGVHDNLASVMALAEEFACRKPKQIDIQQSIEGWTTERRLSTIEGSMSFDPSIIADQRDHIEKVAHNIAGVIAVWVLRRV